MAKRFCKFIYEKIQEIPQSSVWELQEYRKRRYKRPGRLLGTPAEWRGGWAFIKTIFLLDKLVDVALLSLNSCCSLGAHAD